jgi:hypothetical protein
MRRMLVRMAVASVAVLGAVRADAQVESREWRMCTPGALLACSSITMVTSAIMAGDTRTGTAFSIKLAHLAGSPGHVSDPWSYLRTVGFVRNGPLTFGSYAGGGEGWVVGTAHGGAIGSPVGTRIGAYSPPAYMVGINGMNIEGCNAVHFTSYTCGEGAHFSFSFTENAIWNASEINTTYMLAVGAGHVQSQCWSDPGQLTPPNPPDNPACTMLASTEVVPEPASVALVATGLAGLGALRLRRRRQL